MASSQPILDLASVPELVRVVDANEASTVGIIASTSSRAVLLAALTDHFSDLNRRVVHVPTDQLIAELKASLPEWFAEPAEPRTSPDSWRDDLSTELRKTQAAAQERTVIARQQGGNADPFDRDVAGWLAAGLCDLFADKITGESFLNGVFRRLVENPASARFTEADFLRPDGLKFLEAARSAQSMLTKLSLASTGQFRAAAVRLTNDLLGKLSNPTPQIPEAVILVENVDSLSGWNVPASVRLFVFDADEARLRERLSDQTVLVRFAEQPTENQLADRAELELILADLQSGASRIALFQQHGLLVPDAPDLVIIQDLIAETSRLQTETTISHDVVVAIRERAAVVLESTHKALNDAWQRWFAQQLNGIDAEWFLRQDPEWDFLDVPEYMEGAREVLLNPVASARLPVNETDFETAKELIAGLHDLDRQWRGHPWTPIEEGMAFDAAVAAGGAPLNMYTKGVRWWLKKENRDWKKYRIVRVD